VNLDISALGYRWCGIYSPYLSYRDGDVVLKDGGAWVIRHGQPQPFALGQQDAILKGHLLTGGVSVGGIGSMVLHSNGTDGVEFRFMADRNGTIATALMNTDRAAADYHSANYFMAAIMNDGSVRAWGRAIYGQQGTGNTGDISRTFPARVAFPPGTPRIVSVNCVWDDTFFIDAEGGLWHAGGNSGYGSPTASANAVPRRVNGVGQLPANAVVKQVITGHDWYGYRMLACLDAQGRVYVWGNNQQGSLGLGHASVVTSPQLVPFTVDTPIKAVFLSGGTYAASYLIDTAGKLWVAGEANSCGFGSDQYTHRLWMPWGTEKRVKKVFCSESDAHWVAGSQYYRSYGVLLEDGALYRWGHDEGQTSGIWGTGYTGTIWTGHALFPYKVLDGVADAYAISGGYGRTLALMQDGTVRHTGNNNYQIGGGSDRTTWATIGGDSLTQVTKLRMYGSSYGSSAMALRADGKAVGWGMGGAGQCGNGYADSSNTPSRFVLIDRPIVDFSRSGVMGCGDGGEYHYGAYHFLTRDGQVMSTGYGSYGQTGDDDSDHRFAPSPILF
jgi:alpha-tubulin suppressor-like RCC1 family protein